MFRYLYEAVRRPWQCPVDTSLWNRFLLKPRVFDLLSVLIQLRDVRRIKEVDTSAAASDSAVDQAMRHNAGQLKRKLVTRARRTEAFYEVATTPWRNVRDEKILIVGSRSTQELWTATLFGFRWDNITAIDLFAVNPKILVMNMEAIEFPDASFDVVTMANTLGYAADPAGTVRGVARVLRPGGRFVFNHVFDPGETEWGQAGHVKGQDIYAALLEENCRLYYYEPSDKINARGRRQTSHLIGVRKLKAAEENLDLLEI